MDEKQVTRNKGWHVPANPQKRFVKRFDVAATGRDCHNTKSSLAEGWQHSGRACTEEKAVLEFKFYLHIFYFGNNSLVSGLCGGCGVGTQGHHGNNTNIISVAEGWLPKWHVQWTEKQIFNVNQRIRETGSCFRLNFRLRGRSHWEGKLNSKGKLNFTCDLSGMSARCSSYVTDWHGWTSFNCFVIHKNKDYPKRFSQVWFKPMIQKGFTKK